MDDHTEAERAAKVLREIGTWDCKGDSVSDACVYVFGAGTWERLIATQAIAPADLLEEAMRLHRDVLDAERAKEWADGPEAEATESEMLDRRAGRFRDFLAAHLRAPAAGSAPPAQQAGWVSVDERLPHKFEEVLIAFRDTPLAATGQYTASPHDTRGWCFPKENDPEETGPVTHWMPLPPAPQHQGGGNAL